MVLVANSCCALVRHRIDGLEIKTPQSAQSAYVRHRIDGLEKRL